MTLPTVIGAYNDCLDYFDQALLATKGIRIQFADYTVAKYFVLRMSQARVLQRDESRRVYPRDDPKWGRSEYDGLQVRNPIEDEDGLWWVNVERHNARVLTVEEIE
jgi:hypothetical protein